MLFAIRKIRNGTVKINGKRYAPREEYHGELDGLWYTFGLYEYLTHRKKSFVSLWGTKEQYYVKPGKEADELFGRTPDCIDSVFHWTWWDEI